MLPLEDGNLPDTSVVQFYELVGSTQLACLYIQRPPKPNEGESVSGKAQASKQASTCSSKAVA